MYSALLGSCPETVSASVIGTLFLFSLLTTLLANFPPVQVKSELQGRPFTALVNTIDAGGAISPIESQDLSSLKRLFDINTFGTLAVVQAFLPLIREHGSRLVLMSSLCAHLTSPLFGGLCASKAALE